MPANTDCLVGLVGLTRVGSVCFPVPQGAPAAYTESTTGLYLDEVAGLTLKPATSTTPAADVYARLAKAMNQATQEVAARLAMRLTTDTPRFTEAGQIGGLGKGIYEPLGTPARLVFRTQARPGGGLALLNLQLLTDVVVADVPVLLDGEEIARITTNAAPVALTGVAAPYDGAEHVLEANLPAGAVLPATFPITFGAAARVRQNTLTCGCGNAFVNALRRSLVDVRAPAGGFALAVRETCVAPGGLCYAVEGDEDLARSVGLALQYSAAAVFAAGLMTDAQYSRYTLLEPKQLSELGALWTAKADEWLTWLMSPHGLSRVQHPCYACASAAWHPTMQRVY